MVEFESGEWTDSGRSDDLGWCAPAQQELHWARYGAVNGDRAWSGLLATRRQAPLTERYRYLRNV